MGPDQLRTIAGVAFIGMLVAIALSLVLRSLLLRELRTRHYPVYNALGRPTNRQLASLLPRDREAQVQFWKFLWGAQPFAMGDARVKLLAGAARATDVAVVAGVVALLWTGRGAR